MNYNTEIKIVPQKIIASKRHYFLVMFLAFFLPLCIGLVFWLFFYPRDSGVEQNISFIVYAIFFSLGLFVLVTFSLYVFTKRSGSDPGGDRLTSSAPVSKNSDDSKTQSFLIITSSKQYYFALFVTACGLLLFGALATENFYYISQDTFKSGGGFFSYIREFLRLSTHNPSFGEVVTKAVIHSLLLVFASLLLFFFIKDGYT